MLLLSKKIWDHSFGMSMPCCVISKSHTHDPICRIISVSSSTHPYMGGDVPQRKEYVCAQEWSQTTALTTMCTGQQDESKRPILKTCMYMCLHILSDDGGKSEYKNQELHAEVNWAKINLFFDVYFAYNFQFLFDYNIGNLIHWFYWF